MKHPYEESRLAKFLEKRILELRSRKSQGEVARQAGFPNPNVISMLKSGASKLPLDRVLPLAEALETDPRHLLVLALEQIAGSTASRAIEEIIGTVVSRNELAWLEEIRDASGGSDPALTSRSRVQLRAIFGR